MSSCERIMKLRSLFMWLALAAYPAYSKAQASASGTGNPPAQAQSTTEVLNTIDQLVEQNKELEEQNRKLVDQIQILRQMLAKTPSTPGATATETAPATGPPATTGRSQQSEQQQTSADSFTAEEEPYKWGTYTPNAGFKVANTDRGDMSISLYTYARYLNQLGLDGTYTDAFGNVKTVQQRQDFQLNKVQIKFLGWILDPKLRYFLYAWSSNASQGLGAQVVLAGNLSYSFNKSFNVGFGIRSLPGTRSVEGNFPFWLGVDTRLISDEFFRPSYTSGVWAWGKIIHRLEYISMIGNNLSTLGKRRKQRSASTRCPSLVRDAHYW